MLVPIIILFLSGKHFIARLQFLMAPGKHEINYGKYIGFPIPALMNYCNFGSLKQHRLIILQFCSSEVRRYLTGLKMCQGAGRGSVGGAEFFLERSIFLPALFGPL